MNNTQEVQQIVDFYSTIEGDSRIGLKHISLYMALLSEYITAASQLPIYVNRDRLMIIAKMSRKTLQQVPERIAGIWLYQIQTFM
jgi:hypothetical protein